jgi:hypothetical protein
VTFTLATSTGIYAISVDNIEHRRRIRPEKARP